jgi:hypothetical protein
MGLQWSLPKSLQKQLKIKANALVQMARSWMPVAAELKIWTFYETIDTDLTDGKVNESDRVSFQAPITSIKSAILELHHEIDRPLQANHADCAAFGYEDEYTKWKFIRKLRDAATLAVPISRKKHTTIGLDRKVEVEVHGFYETRDQAQEKRSIRLWSTSNPLVDFLKDGPAKCLQNRLQEKTVPPNRTQMINATSSRRGSFLQRSPSTTQNARQSQKARGSKADPPSSRPTFSLLNKNKSDPALESTAAGPLQRRFSRPSIDRASSAQKSSAIAPGLSAALATQSGQPAGPMPSVLVSEHGGDESRSIPQSPTGRRRSEAELTVSNHRKERLSPLSVPSRPNPAPLSPIASDQQDSGDSGTESNEDEATTAGPPTRPDPNSQKLVWIHLAYNNPKWVSVSYKAFSDGLELKIWKDIFSAISKERDEKLNESLLHEIVWCKRHIRGRNTQYHACFVKPGCVLIHPILSETCPLSPQHFLFLDPSPRHFGQWGRSCLH